MSLNSFCFLYACGAVGNPPCREELFVLTAMWIWRSLTALLSATRQEHWWALWTELFSVLKLFPSQMTLHELSSNWCGGNWNSFRVAQFITQMALTSRSPHVLLNATKQLHMWVHLFILRLFPDKRAFVNYPWIGAVSIGTREELFTPMAQARKSRFVTARLSATRRLDLTAL